MCEHVPSWSQRFGELACPACASDDAHPPQKSQDFPGTFPNRHQLDIYDVLDLDQAHAGDLKRLHNDCEGEMVLVHHTKYLRVSDCSSCGCTVASTLAAFSSSYNRSLNDERS